MSTNPGLQNLLPSILAASQRTGLDPKVIAALLSTESDYRQNAVSPKGATGPGQMMPQTFGEVMPGGDINDPNANVMASAVYLKKLLGTFPDTTQAVQAYNAGPGAMREINAGRRPMPAETQRQGQVFGERLGELRSPGGPQLSGEAASGQRQYIPGRALEYLSAGPMAILSLLNQPATAEAVSDSPPPRMAQGQPQGQPQAQGQARLPYLGQPTPLRPGHLLMRRPDEPGLPRGMAEDLPPSKMAKKPPSVEQDESAKTPHDPRVVPTMLSSGESGGMSPWLKAGLGLGGIAAALALRNQIRKDDGRLGPNTGAALGMMGAGIRGGVGHYEGIKYREAQRQQGEAAAQSKLLMKQMEEDAKNARAQMGVAVDLLRERGRDDRFTRSLQEKVRQFDVLEKNIPKIPAQMVDNFETQAFATMLQNNGDASTVPIPDDFARYGYTPDVLTIRYNKFVRTGKREALSDTVLEVKAGIATIMIGSMDGLLSPDEKTHEQSAETLSSGLSALRDIKALDGE